MASLSDLLSKTIKTSQCIAQCHFQPVQLCAQQSAKPSSLETRPLEWFAMKAEHFEEILLQIHPDNAEQLLGKKFEISGLPMAMGKQSLQDFLGEWRVHPLYTYRQGFRRTWIVRSSQEPTEKMLQHDFGLAVIKDAPPRKSPLSTERVIHSEQTEIHMR